MAVIHIQISDVSSVVTNRADDGSQEWDATDEQLSQATGIIESAIANALQVEDLEGTVEISWEN